MVLRNTTSGSINAICFGLKKENEEINAIFSELRSSREQAFNFFWLPMSLLSLTCAEMPLQCGRISHSLWKVQSRTGLHGGGYGKDLRLLEGKHDLVEQGIVDLTAVLDRCARFLAKVDTVKRLLDVLNRSNDHRQNDNGVSSWMTKNLEINRQTVLGCQEYLQWFQQSASSQLQTVSLGFHSINLL